MCKQCVVAFLHQLAAQGPAGWVPSLHVTVAHAPQVAAAKKAEEAAAAAKKAEEVAAKNMPHSHARASKHAHRRNLERLPQAAKKKQQEQEEAAQRHEQEVRRSPS